MPWLLQTQVLQHSKVLQPCGIPVRVWLVCTPDARFDQSLAEARAGLECIFNRTYASAVVLHDG